MSLSGLKDTDREILKHIDDEELLKVCHLDRKTWNKVCDDNFLKRRLSKYPGIEKYKRSDESWKEFFLRVLYYIGKIKEQFRFSYTVGDFKRIYDLLKTGNWSELLIKASEEGDISLVKYVNERGANMNLENYHEALVYASKNGHLEVVKYLTKHSQYALASLKYAATLANLNRHVGVAQYLDQFREAESAGDWNFGN